MELGLLGLVKEQCCAVVKTTEVIELNERLGIHGK